jgi:beta-phosphoglucomutase
VAKLHVSAIFNMSVASGWALVFDLDGVVIDSMPLHTEAWRVYLERLGIASPEIEERMHGRRNDEIVSYFLGAGLSASEVFEHGAAKERLFREMMRPQLQEHLVPGIAEFLERANGTPIGLATNAEPANLDFVLDGTGLRARFNVIVDGHQVSRPKPFPDIYLKTAALLNVAPGHCVVFEDSPTGIQAARASGAKVVAVHTHPAPLPDTDLLIRNFRDPALNTWLESLPPVL